MIRLSSCDIVVRMFHFPPAGKQRHIKLLHTSAMEGYEVEPVKIQETKGSMLFSTNTGQGAATTYLCVAFKRTVTAFELYNSRQKYMKKREISVAGQVQFMSVWGHRLCVGYQSCFVIYDLSSNDAAPMSLVNADDNQLKFLSHSPVDSMLAVEISEKEFLLAFSGKYSLSMIISLEFCFIVRVVVNLSSNFFVISLLVHLHVKPQDYSVNKKQRVRERVA